MRFDRLEALIKEQGRKKSYLCEKAGKKRGYISDAQNGNGSISDEALEVFARELGTTTAYLKGETDERGQKETPGTEAGRSDDDIKFALFGGGGEITDAMFDEVKQFAQMVKLREENKKKKE